MRPAIASWIVTGDTPVSYWPMFIPLSVVTAPDVFAKVDWVQFPSRFYSGKLITRTVIAGTCGEASALGRGRVCDEGATYWHFFRSMETFDGSICLARISTAGS